MTKEQKEFSAKALEFMAQQPQPEFILAGRETIRRLSKIKAQVKVPTPGGTNV